MTDINFGQLMEQASAGFEPVPDDTYDVEVIKTEAVTSSTGKPMIKVQHQICGGPHNGRKLFDQFVISADNPNALGFFFEHMLAFGLDKAFFASNPPLSQVAQALMGRRAKAKVGSRTWQGREQNDVQGYTPSGNPQIGGAPLGGPSIPGPGATAAPAPVATPAPDPVAVPAPAPAGPPPISEEPF